MAGDLAALRGAQRAAARQVRRLPRIVPRLLADTTDDPELHREFSNGW